MIGILAAGPAFFWAFPIVLVGQLFVCGVFGNLVSKWPLQGSVYAWSRELIGPRYGWFTGWAYMWGLTLTLAVLPLAAAPYLLGALGVDAPVSRSPLNWSRWACCSSARWRTSWLGGC